MVQKRGKSEDLRVRRTQSLLQKALIELTIEKGFAVLTVRDITERAMVNRSTFYRHYLDKYALLHDFMDEVYGLTESGEAELSLVQKHQEGGKPPAGLVSLLKHMQMYADFYRVMLGEQGDRLFVERVRQYIEKRLRRLLPAEIPQAEKCGPPVDLSISYMSYAGVGALVWWLNNEQPCTPEQLAMWLNRFSQADIGLSLVLPAGVAQGDAAEPTE